MRDKTFWRSRTVRKATKYYSKKTELALGKAKAAVRAISRYEIQAKKARDQVEAKYAAALNSKDPLIADRARAAVEDDLAKTPTYVEAKRKVESFTKIHQS